MSTFITLCVFARAILSQLEPAVQQCHSAGVAHGDLSSTNVLLQWYRADESQNVLATQDDLHGVIKELMRRHAPTETGDGDESSSTSSSAGLASSPRSSWSTKSTSRSAAPVSQSGKGDETTKAIALETRQHHSFDAAH